MGGFGFNAEAFVHHVDRAASKFLGDQTSSPLAHFVQTWGRSEVTGITVFVWVV